MVEYSATKIIEAERSCVWAAINDPEILKQCIPGCQEFEGNSAEGYSAVVTQKIGPVKATFRGNVELIDVVDETSCTIVGEGKGGAAGFAKGSAKVALRDADEGTELTYEIDARVGGKIAQIGSRLVKGAAKKVADEFFSRLQDQFSKESNVD